MTSVVNHDFNRFDCKGGHSLLEMIAVIAILGIVTGLTFHRQPYKAMQARPRLIHLEGVLASARPGDCFEHLGSTLIQHQGSRVIRMDIRGVRVESPGARPPQTFCFAPGKLAIILPDGRVWKQDICFVPVSSGAGRPVCLSPLAVVYHRAMQ